MTMVWFRCILILAFGAIAWAGFVLPGFAAEVSGTRSLGTMEEIDRQLESDPLSEKYLIAKAVILFKQKNYPAVIALVKPLLVRNPNCTLALEATAKSYSRLNEDGKAIDFLSRLIELKPTYDSFFLRCSCLIRVGLYSEALRDNDRCIKLCPRDGRCYLLRAEIHGFWVGIDDQFEKYVNKAIELSPDNPEVQLDFANASKLIREMRRKRSG